MKRELLRLYNISAIPHDGQIILKNFDLNVYQGEFVFILTSSNSSKDALTNILSGITRFSGAAYFKEKPVRHIFSNDDTGHAIVSINKTPDLFPEMSIADNISLYPGANNPRFLMNRQERLGHTYKRLDALSVIVNPQEKVKNLSKFMQNMIALAKVFDERVKLVVFNDNVNLYSKTELAHFNIVLHKLLSSGVSVLYLSSKVYDFCDFADRIIYMKDGEKIKTIFQDDFSDLNELVQMISKTGIMPYEMKSAATLYTTPGSSDKKIIYFADQILCGSMQEFDLRLSEGQILGILSKNYEECIKLSNVLSGKEKPISGSISLLMENRKYTKRLDRIRRRIRSLDSDFAYTQTFPNLSIYQNIDLFFYRNNRLSYFNPFKQGTIKKFLQQEIAIHLQIPVSMQGSSFQCLDIGKRQELVLYNLLLQKPQVLVCCAPFFNMDNHLKARFHHYLALYQKMGCSTIIVSPTVDNFAGICEYITLY